MSQPFQGWEAVAKHLRQQADLQDQRANEKGEDSTHLNPGQRAKPARHCFTHREKRRSDSGRSWHG